MWATRWLPSGAIHPSAWKGRSPNFALMGLSEVRIAPVRPMSAGPIGPGQREGRERPLPSLDWMAVVSYSENNPSTHSGE
jgi:hypothetical protein